MNKQNINNVSSRKLEIFQNNALKFINTESNDQDQVVPFYFKSRRNFKLKLPSLQVSRIMIGNESTANETYCQNNKFGRRKPFESPSLSQPLLNMPDPQIDSELKRKIRQKCLLKNVHRITLLHKQK
ncbi:unnamed protein product (macronuclear) [Paramecium tetraurelia]|uniref:Uncharacterized protein n=1 Tax=Paramecium tetraurelia TaxID=5888 RepID=A0BCC3_PARTE|nr:uncharacterized protein GSPATT00004284001 [Paramecium tetraurelia]CAK56190.1 unnamed protein product [Paramecium tetraurelia]|eukprot:XP_001423588.1 hypothetical protein (macronuclear) [Paramecium tetraurelia strain d4-2]